MSNCLYRIKTKRGISGVLTEDLLFTMIMATRRVGPNGEINFNNLKGYLDYINNKESYKFSFEESVEIIKSILEEAEKNNLGGVKTPETIGVDEEYEKAESILQFLEDQNKSGIRYKTDALAYLIALELNPGEYASDIVLEEAAKALEHKWYTLSTIGQYLHRFIAIGFNHLDDFDKFEQALQRFKDDTEDPILAKRFNSPESKRALFNALHLASASINLKLKTSTDPDRKREYVSRLPIVSKTLNGHTIGSTIDKLIIDLDGIPHVFLFKFTLTDPKNWPINKTLKYIDEMAILKHMLIEKGFTKDKVDKGSFDIIPIWIDFDSEDQVTGLQCEELLSFQIKDEKSPIENAYDKLKKFFPEHNDRLYSKDITLNDDLQIADQFKRLVYPKLDAKSIGDTLSAEAWIRSAEYKHKIYPARSADDVKNGVYWYIKYSENVEPIPIKDSRPILSNPEILELVKQHIDEISSELPVLSALLGEAIKNSYATNHSQFDRRNFKRNSQLFENIFGRYFEQQITEGEEENVWIMLKNPALEARNIFLFLNVNTGQIDVVLASGYRLGIELPMRYHLHNILGEYEMDMKGVTSLNSSYGNLEILYVAAILNQLSLSLDEPKFGNIHIVSPHSEGDCKWISAKRAMNEYTKVSLYLNKYLGEGEKFETYVDSSNFISELACIDGEIQQIKSTCRDSIKGDYITKLGFEKIKEITSLPALLAALRDMCKTIEDDLGTNNLEQIVHIAQNDPSIFRRTYARIYEHAVYFINYHTGFINPEIKHINKFKRYVLPLYANPDANLRHITNLYARELDKLAQDFLDTYIKEMRDTVLNFERDMGYSDTKSALLGNGNYVYKKLYKYTSDGRNTFTFVNPYDSNEVKAADLSDKEIAFLKKVLFYMAKIRAKANGLVFSYTNENDPQLHEYYENERNNYFLVPLIHASKSLLLQTSLSRRVDLDKQWLRKVSSWEKLQLYLLDKINSKRSETTYEYGDSPETSIYAMEIPKGWALQENEYERELLLNGAHETEFEQNVGYLLSEYTEESLKYQHMKNVEFAARCLLFLLHTLGELLGEHAKKYLKESIKEIEDYMKFNLYGRSLMTDIGFKFTEVMEPARRLMTKLFIAGNLKSMFRDSFEGVWKNLSSTINHYHTDLKTAHVLNAYKDVMQNMFKSDRSLNIMSELCLRYRLSNCDESRIAERAKTGKSGVYNPGHMAFITLTGPDFLNRMVLFVARCRQDGVWGAFSLDNNHLLIYDARKDLRFEAYFKPEGKSDDEILMARNAYYNAVHAYNLEHAELKQINPNSKEMGALLPEPYSQNEVLKIRLVADELYGAYGISQKAKYENLALGHALGVFSTWFNGTVATWLREPGVYAEYVKSVGEDGNSIVKTNEAGNKLFFTQEGLIVEQRADGKFYDEISGNEVQSEWFTEVIDKVPIPVQGILGTLSDAWNVLSNTLKVYNPITGEYESVNRIELFKSLVWAYDVNRENIEKALYDALIVAIYALLFGTLFTPWYEEEKKKKADDLLSNALLELLYKSSVQSFDGFFGPYSIIDYCINDVRPMGPGVTISLIKDCYKTIMGDKSYNAFIYNYLPIFRNFKDTARRHDPDSFKAPNSME